MSVTVMALVFNYDMPELKTDKGETVPDSTSKFVLLALADHSSDDGRNSYAGVDRLCKKTNFSTSTVCNALNALRTNGYVTLHGKSYLKTNDYIINISRLQPPKFQPPKQSDSTSRNDGVSAAETKPSINHPLTINHGVVVSNSKNTQQPESKTPQIHYDEWGNEIDLKDLPAPAESNAESIPPQEVILESKKQTEFICPFCVTKQKIDLNNHVCSADGCHARIVFMVNGKPLIAKSSVQPQTAMAKLLRDMTSKSSPMFRWTNFKNQEEKDAWEKLESLSRKENPETFTDMISWATTVDGHGIPKDRIVSSIFKAYTKWKHKGSGFANSDSQTPSKPKRTSAEIMREQDEYMKRTRGDDE